MNSRTTLMNKFIATILTSLLISTTLLAGNYTWNGGTSTAWGTSTNWTPNGTPSTNDTVTIVTGSNNVYLSAKTTVKMLTINSGTVNLQSNDLDITSIANFNAGTINSGKLNIYASGTITFAGTTFGAKVFASGYILLNGSVFNDSLTVTKKGKGVSNCKGGNTFNGHVSLYDSALTAIVLADSFPDVFNSTLNVQATSTGAIYLAHRASGNQFNGNVSINSPNVYSNYYGTATYSGNLVINSSAGDVFFGSSTGSCTLIAGKKISIGGSGMSSGLLYLRNFTSLDSSSKITLNMTGTAKLYFESGSVFYDSISATVPSLYLNGTKFLGVAILGSTGSSGVTSTGGCYFAKSLTFTNDLTSGVYAFANAATDTFNVKSTFVNKGGTFTLNKGYFKGKCTINNTPTSGEGFFIAPTGLCTFKDTLYFDFIGAPGVIFGNSGGTTVLDSSCTLSFNPGQGGNMDIKNLTKLSSSPTVMNESPQYLALNTGNIFNGKFTFDGSYVYLNGSTFNDSTTIRMHSNTTTSSSGGNIFNGVTLIQDSSSSTHSTYLAYSSADDYNANVTFINKGSNVNLYPCYTKNSTFAGNITTGGTNNIVLGNNGGKAIIDGTGSQSTNAGVIKKLQINKPSGSLTLVSSLNVTDSLQLTKGIINTDTTYILSVLHGGKLVGGSDSSYINGPLKKIGSSSFTFATGSSSLAHPYHPLEITAPTSSSDAYTANYFATSQTLGTAIDSTIDNLNACQYWKLTRNVGTSKVKVKLSWNNDSCETISPTNFRVTGWNGSMWEDLGNSATSGDSISGIVQSVDSLDLISNLTLAFFRCSSFKKSVLKSDISCHGDVDGYAEIRLTGGTPPYKYSWSDAMGDQPQTPRVLFAGEFFVNGTDSLNCSLNDSVTISEPSLIAVFIISNPSICGDSVGSAIVTATGGIGSVKSYFWTEKRVTNDTLLNIPSGDYTVLVTDSNGCSLFGTVQISDSDGPTISIATDTAISCYGDLGGYSEISVSGNTPFSYEWSTSPSDTSNFISNVYAGIYSVKVTDSVGCVSYQSIEIDQPDTFNIELTVTDASCTLNNDGLVIATVQGGATPYNYLWYSSPGINNDSLINRPSGLDTLLVTDANGCTISSIVEIMNSGGFTLTTLVLSNETCFMDTSGSATVAISGGSSPFTYSWFPYGGTNDTAYNLNADIYSITVIDNNGCRKKADVTISGPEPLTVDIDKILPRNDIEPDGYARAIVLGGNGPYTYNWNTGSTTFLANGLTFDSDTVTVEDGNGCRTTSVFRGIPHYVPNGPCPYSNTPDDVSACTALFTAPPITPIIELSIEDFGADGLDDLSDECYFELAAAYFSTLDSEIVKILNIPKGTYYIGKQDVGGGFWLSGHNVLSFSEVRNLTIRGTVDSHNNPTSILKLNQCMRYGAFNPVTGQRHIGYTWVDPQPNQTLADATVTSNDYNLCATVGDMIFLNYCNRITIEDLELDGNISETVIGGGYTEGIQLGSYSGIALISSRNVTIDNVRIHHFGYDGLLVRDAYCPVSGVDSYDQIGLNLILNKCQFTFNARNNMTWAGGYKVTAHGCIFNYAGEARYVSKPGAGLDIEYEPYGAGWGYSNSRGYFYDCHFEYNFNYGMISDINSIRSTNYKFINCQFTGSNFSMQNSSRQMEFDECNFVGTVSSHYGNTVTFARRNRDLNRTKFSDCRFLEEWNVPSVGLRSFQQTADEFFNCNTTGHRYLLNVQGARTEFLRSYTVTNFTMKDAYFDLGGISLDWWNRAQFDNMNFYNHGLSECGCDRGDELSVLSNINFNYRNGASSQRVATSFYHLPGPGCTGSAYAYSGALDGLRSSAFNRLTQVSALLVYNASQCCLGIQNPVPKYELLPAPDWVYDLFTSNTIIPFYDTYDGIQEICTDPIERKKYNVYESYERKLIYLYPTIASEIINIETTNLSGQIVIRN